MGPSSTILLKTAPDEVTLAVIHKIVADFSSEKNGDDFYVSPQVVSASEEEGLRPFGIEMHARGEDDDTQAEHRDIAAKFAFYPRYEIVLYAMSKSPTDHKILGLLTLKIAEATGGLIDFGGKLDQENLEQLPGILQAIDYTIDEQSRDVYHVCNIEFMRNWLAHPHFYMMK